MTGKYDKRNKLNDLTGKEWLLLTKSFWISEKCKDDISAMKHPAPFLVRDISKLISMFTKEGMKILDPFVGSGTTLLAAAILKRFGIGIDLNKEYRDLASKRLLEHSFVKNKDYVYILGDSIDEIKNIDNIHYIVTSPPYHNILQNKGGGLRANKNNSYRTGARLGVEYYSDLVNDLGNQESYEDFLNLFKKIMIECYRKLIPNKYCSIIISDFTVNKKEVCVQGDIVDLMTNIGFEFSGTTILIQNNKPLYPFGYPFAFKINHQHQNIINFRKV